MNPAQMLRIFVRHRNAANLMMLLLISVGLVSLFKLNTQFFPDFGIDAIVISVAWPGASAEDVEGNIIDAIEPEVRFLDSVDKVRSFAREGVGTIVINYKQGSDMQKALSAAESAVARITTLPESSERPVISNPARYDTIARLILSGPYSEKALKAIAKDVRDRLLNSGIDRINLFGARSEEIWIEISPTTLRRLNVTLETIAAKVRATSQDVPSGRLRLGRERQIRTIGQQENAFGFGQVEVRSLKNGEKIYLRDIAKVKEAFDRTEPSAARHGRAAVELNIKRAASADALNTAALFREALAKIRPSLPAAVQVEVFDVRSNLIRDRIFILLKNGFGGLFLVVSVLFIFLNFRVAFWVAMGIPVALFGTLIVMLASGQSINMVSLFALIMTLGIIVDDAIVVGEHAATLRAQGLAPGEAAERGALRMLAPVVASSLTTVAAFLPLIVIGDIIGTIIRAIPFVTVSVLIASLLECFLILPAHMRGALRYDIAKESRFRRAFNRGFDRFRRGPYRWLLVAAVRGRYVTVAFALAMLIICVGLMVSGRVGFNFFPSPESDVVLGNIKMAPGTPRAQTFAMVRELERAANAAAKEFVDNPSKLMVVNYGSVGQSQAEEFQQLSGDRYGGVYVELISADIRNVRMRDFITAWRKHIKALPGVERISLNERLGGPPGREIDIRLWGGEANVLKSAAREIRDLLARFPGVSDVEDDLPVGKQEIELQVTAKGKAMGFTTETVARQVRHAFEGAIAKRFVRGDAKVTVRVQYPRATLGMATFRALHLRGPDGSAVPLSEIVAISETAGFDRIRRENGRREVAVTGEIDEAVTNADRLYPALTTAGLSEIVKRYRLSYRFAGKAEEQARTFADMKFGAAIAMISIYVILAWVFASYSRPLVVMAVIPFGLVGAVIGHMVLDFNLTVLSMVALLGLSGILVNDSIILVSTIDERITAGEKTISAIIDGAQDRLRAVILTSLTTILGLTPLLFEKSLQAQFLIPMAITIVFGLAVATFLVLLLVPALLAIGHDLARLMGRAEVEAIPSFRHAKNSV